jgi:magnesium-transporting ATPase (P-type)
MTVQKIWLEGQELTVSGSGYEPVGKISPAPAGPLRQDLQLLLDAATLCNNSRLSAPSPVQPRWTVLGDQTEAALRVAARKGGVDETRLAQALPRFHELPFDARRKRMSTLHRLQNGARPAWLGELLQANLPAGGSPTALAFVKGAPRETLQLCAYTLDHGQVRPLAQEGRLEIEAAIDRYARGGLRVLALAFRGLPRRDGVYTPERVESDLIFLGLMAMLDPPRPEVAEAVRVCREAGIRMVMVTGDYGLTAESLARRIGMLTGDHTLIVTGAELDEMEEAQLQALLEQEVVFARMAPEHKLRLVDAFQKRGEVVAVTGDGVNDAPALRKADVGVVMGVTGTDVAKEAADLVLVNDNFATITNAIEEGRAVYDNLRKFLTYIFSSNVPEVLPFLLTALTGIPLALTVPQILAIDLGTDMLPGLALGTEKPEPGSMLRQPRRRNRPLIDRSLLERSFLWLGLIETALAYSGFALVYSLAGRGPLAAFFQAYGWRFPSLLQTVVGRGLPVHLLAVTVFHAGVVMAQAGNAFACRSEIQRGRRLGWWSNRFLMAGVAVEIGLILLLIYFPPLAKAFNHLPLPPVFWAWLALYPLILYGVEWMRKSVKRKMEAV